MMIIYLLVFISPHVCVGRTLRGLSETTDDNSHSSTMYDDTIDYQDLHGGYEGSDVYMGDEESPDDEALDAESPDEESPVDRPLSFEELEKIKENERKQKEAEKQSIGLFAGFSFIILILGALYKKCKSKC